MKRPSARLMVSSAALLFSLTGGDMDEPPPRSATQLASLFRAQADRVDAQAQALDRAYGGVAAGMLRRLAAYLEAGHADPRVTDALNRHVFVGSELGGEQTQRAVSDLGSLLLQRSGWQARILEELLATCLSDAYTRALINNGFDWTGTLLEFELDAARDGVSIPHSYWQQRAAGRSVKATLAAAIRSFRIEND